MKITSNIYYVPGTAQNSQNALYYLVKTSQRFGEEKPVMLPFYRSGNEGSNCSIPGPQSKKVVVSNSGTFLP